MTNPPDAIDALTAQILYGLEHDLFSDPTGRSLVDIWDAKVADETIREVIEGRVRKHQFQQAMSGVPFRPADCLSVGEPGMRKGKVIIGLGLDGRPIQVPLQFWNAHCLTVAGSGAGKTLRNLLISLQILPQLPGAFLFDLRKREWRKLNRLLKPCGCELTVVEGRAMRFNLLQVPEGVPPEQWASYAAAIVVGVYGMPRRAAMMIQSTIIKLYRRFGVYEGRKTYPTLFDLFVEVKKMKQANAQSRRAVLDALEPTMLSLGPEVLAYRYAWPVEKLAKHRLIFELAGLTDTDRDLILTWLVMGIFAQRVALGVSNPKMDLWIAFDEAQRLCASGMDGSSEVINDLIGLVRGTGIGMDLSLQSMGSGIVPGVISNTALKVMGRGGSPLDIRAAASACLGLNAEQMRWAELNLRPGLFIGKLGEGPHRHPFVFEVPKAAADRFEAKCAGAAKDVDSAAGLDLGPLAALPLVPSDSWLEI